MTAIHEPEQAVVNRRCPTDEGEGQWGCHTDVADNLAAIADSWSEVYQVLVPLFEKWDKHMTQFIREETAPTKRKVRFEGLAWLLANGAEAFSLVKECARESDAEMPEPTPDETRDWFCWLYRQFASWAQDQNQ